MIQNPLAALTLNCALTRCETFRDGYDIPGPIAPNTMNERFAASIISEISDWGKEPSLLNLRLLTALPRMIADWQQRPTCQTYLP